MHDLDELLNSLDRFATVIIASVSEGPRDSLLRRLAQTTLNVVGPVDRASHALALAAQTPADLAIIETDLAGRRDGHALAKLLEDTWGVRSFLLGGRSAPACGAEGAAPSDA